MSCNETFDEVGIRKLENGYVIRAGKMSEAREFVAESMDSLVEWLHHNLSIPEGDIIDGKKCPDCGRKVKL
jgi:hypothetical protein